MDDLILLLLIACAVAYICVEKAKERRQSFRLVKPTVGDDDSELLSFEKFDPPLPPRSSDTSSGPNAHRDDSSYVPPKKVHEAWWRIVEYTVRDFVDWWFVPYCSIDKEMPNDVREIMDDMFLRLSSKAVNVDWTLFISQKVLVPFKDLLSLLKITEKKLLKSKDHKYKTLTFPERVKLVTSEILSSYKLHPAAMSCLKENRSEMAEVQRSYLRLFSTALLSKIIRMRDFRCNVLRNLGRELLINNLLFPTIGFAEPVYINAGILAALKAMEGGEEDNEDDEEEEKKEKKEREGANSKNFASGETPLSTVTEEEKEMNGGDTATSGNTGAPTASTALSSLSTSASKLSPASSSLPPSGTGTGEEGSSLTPTAPTPNGAGHGTNSSSPSDSAKKGSPSGKHKTAVDVDVNATSPSSKSKSSEESKDLAVSPSVSPDQDDASNTSGQGVVTKLEAWDAEKERRRRISENAKTGHSDQNASDGVIGVSVASVIQTSSGGKAEGVHTDIDMSVVANKTLFDPRPYTVYVVRIRRGHYKYDIMKRYSQFEDLHKHLKSKFPDFDGQLPKKHLFNLGRTVIQQREVGLQRYVEKLKWSRDIFENPIFQDFIKPVRIFVYSCVVVVEGERRAERERKGEENARVVRSGHRPPCCLSFFRCSIYPSVINAFSLVITGC